MVEKERIQEKVSRFLTIVGIWLVIALLVSSTSLIAYAGKISLSEFLGRFIYEIFCLSPWILFTPFIIKKAREYRFDRHALPVFLGVHIGVALMVFLIHNLVQSYFSFVKYDVTLNLDYLISDFLLFFDMRVMLYIGVLLIVYIYDFEKRDKKTSLKKAQLQNQLNLVKIQALVHKFQPVFFMNSIDAVKQFLRSDAAESENILNNFSDLLRIMLRKMDDDQSTIQEGLGSLDLYLDVLESRLGNEIKRDIQIDEDCLNVLVPLPSVFIPIMEKVLEIVQTNQGTLFKFIYKAFCEEGQFKGVISLGVLNTPHSVLVENLEKTVFEDLNDYLKTQYGDKGCVKIDDQKEEYFGWTLSIPLKRQSREFNEGGRK